MKKSSKKKSAKTSKKVPVKKTVSNETRQCNRLAFLLLSKRASQRTRVAVAQQEQAVIANVDDVKHEYTCYHRRMTQAALIDMMLQQSATMSELVRAMLLSDVQKAQDKKIVIRRIKSHFRHLREKHSISVSFNAESKRYSI